MWKLFYKSSLSHPRLEFYADYGEAGLGQSETLNYKARSRIFKEFGMRGLKQELFEAT